MSRDRESKREREERERETVRGFHLNTEGRQKLDYWEM
jgi:hypothetical protein